MNWKLIFYLLIVYAIVGSILYLTGVFYNVSFDLSKWNETSRAIISFCFVVFSIFGTAGLFGVLDREEKKP